MSHDKTNKVTVRPAKTQISLGIRPVWSESSLSAWRKLGSLATQWAQSEDSDQTGRMPRLIWVFAGRTLTLLVLSCRGSNSFALWLTSLRFVKIQCVHWKCNRQDMSFLCSQNWSEVKWSERLYLERVAHLAKPILHEALLKQHEHNTQYWLQRISTCEWMN